MYVVGRRIKYAAQILFNLFVTNSAFPTIPQIPGQATASSVSERLPNDIQWSPRTATLQNAVPYLIPNTTITLNFTHFGSRIPVVRAMSTIYNARQQVLSHLISNSENATIDNEIFEYKTQSALPAPVLCSVAVQAYKGLGLSWSQLDQILEGLIQFSSGAGIDHQLHYQTLGFEIKLSDEGRRGIGSLWCTPSRGRGASEIEGSAAHPVAGHEVAKRIDLVSGPSHETRNASRLQLNSAAPVRFPIPDTNDSLDFVWFGTPIPPTTVNDVFRGAFRKLAPFLKESGSEQVPDNQFIYWTTGGGKKDKIAIQVFGTAPPMTWSQADGVVTGVSRFANGVGTRHGREHYRNLEFVVRNGTGVTVGYGNLLATPFSAAAVVDDDERRRRRSIPTLPLHLSNTTTPTPIPASISPWRWPIDGTDLDLLFTYSGAPLPPHDVTEALRTALVPVRVAVRFFPDAPLPDAGFEHHVGAVSVSVTPYEGAEVSWRQLSDVLQGLVRFCGPVAFRQLLVFEVEVVGVGRVGFGRVWGV